MKMSKYKEANEWVSRIKDNYAWIDVNWVAVDQIRDLLSKTKPLRPDSISTSWKIFKGNTKGGKKMKVKVDEATIRENKAKIALAVSFGVDGFCGNCEVGVTKPDKFCRSCGVELGWEMAVWSKKDD